MLEEPAQRRTKPEESWIRAGILFFRSFQPRTRTNLRETFHAKPRCFSNRGFIIQQPPVSLSLSLSYTLYFPPPFSTKIVPLPVRIIPFLIGSNCFRSLFSLFLFFFLSFSIFTSANSGASFHEFSIGRFTAVEWKFYSFVPWWFSLNPQTPLDNVWPKSPFEGGEPRQIFS